MHPQLELLMELQDMRAQSRALAEAKGDLRQVEQEVFDLTPDEARETLDAKIEELADDLEPSVRTRYRQIADNLERVVVPVLNGVCGRFLYYVD